MTSFKLDTETWGNNSLPAFSLSIENTETIAIYSNTDRQAELKKLLLSNKEVDVFDRTDGLYDRMTVEDNVSFFHKWFQCDKPLSEIIVMFELQHITKQLLTKCTVSEIRRVYYAKYYIMAMNKPIIFDEPIYGVDTLTMNVFMNMLAALNNKEIPVFVLVTNMEHALLLGDISYRLQEKGIFKVEIDEEGEDTEQKKEELPTEAPSITKVFKISAKVDDKIILFDPPEIDYIESQGGKSNINIDGESFTMDSTLIEVEKKLEVYGFFRCHRSYIVNLQKVREIITWSKNTYSLKLDNEQAATIPLSRAKVQEIQEIFNVK